MNETITAIALIIGILAMLLALYNVRFDRKVAGKFLIAMFVFYGISFVSAITDKKGEDLMPYFKSGMSLMCKDDIVSLENGWTARDDEYLMKDKKIYFIKMCRKI